MKVIILPSAYKHGITDEDIYAVLENPLIEITDFDESRIPDKPSPNLHIGKSLTGDFLEILSFIQGDTIIFHAMKMRGKTYLRAMNRRKEQ